MYSFYFSLTTHYEAIRWDALKDAAVIVASQLLIPLEHDATVSPGPALSPLLSLSFLLVTQIVVEKITPFREL